MVRKANSSGRSGAVSQSARDDVVFLLNEAEAELTRIEPSAGARRLATCRLEQALDMFWSTVDSWATRPPAGAQVNFIRDHLAEVLKLSRMDAANDPFRRSA